MHWKKVLFCFVCPHNIWWTIKIDSRCQLGWRASTQLDIYNWEERKEKGRRDGERKGKRERELCFYWGQRWRPRVSRADSLLVNLKEWEFKAWEEKKNKWTSDRLSVTYGNQLRSLKQRSRCECVEGGGSVGSLAPSVAGNVLFTGRAIFEVSVSVKWMPLQSKLKFCTCITNKKQKQNPNCQGLHYT